MVAVGGEVPAPPTLSELETASVWKGTLKSPGRDERSECVDETTEEFGNFFAPRREDETWTSGFRHQEKSFGSQCIVKQKRKLTHFTDLHKSPTHSTGM